MKVLNSRRATMDVVEGGYVEVVTNLRAERVKDSFSLSKSNTRNVIVGL